MNGQWIGPYTGTNDGLLVVEFDDAGPHYDGAVYAINNNRTQPASYGEMVVPKGQQAALVHIPLLSLERGTGNIFTERSQEKLPRRHEPEVRGCQYGHF